MDLTGKIEALLFVASKPMTTKQIAKAVEAEKEDAQSSILELINRYNHEDKGVHIIEVDGEVHMVTNPAYAEFLDDYVKSDVTGELTRAQLETLTVIAYCGPVTRPEVEQIRGVNCSVIIRNLMVRGLIRENKEVDSILESYSLTTEALEHLGISSVKELPQYDELHDHEHLLFAKQDDASEEESTGAKQTKEDEEEPDLELE